MVKNPKYEDAKKQFEASEKSSSRFLPSFDKKGNRIRPQHIIAGKLPPPKVKKQPGIICKKKKNCQNYPANRTGAQGYIREDKLFIIGGALGDSKFPSAGLTFQDLRGSESPVLQTPDGNFQSLVDTPHGVFVYGGKSNGYKNTLMCLKEGSWNLIQDIKGTPPPPSYGQSAVYFKDLIFIFGGYTNESGPSNDLTCYSIKDNQWSPQPANGDVPSPRFLHSAVSLPHLNAMIVFGGKLNKGIMSNELFVYNFDDGKWRKIESKGKWPPPRCGMASFILGNKLYIQGGIDTNTDHVFGDIWSLSLDGKFTWHVEQKENALVKNLLPRYYHVAVATDSYVVVYGGRGADHADACFIEKGIINKNKCAITVPPISKVRVVEHQSIFKKILQLAYSGVKLSTFTSPYVNPSLTEKERKKITAFTNYYYHALDGWFYDAYDSNTSDQLELPSDLLQDVQFELDDGSLVSGHKAVFARSSYFRQLLAEDATANRVKLPNISVEQIYSLKHFIYTNQCSSVITPANALSFRDLAQRVALPGLVRLIDTTIASALDKCQIDTLYAHSLANKNTYMIKSIKYHLSMNFDVLSNQKSFQSLPSELIAYAEEHQWPGQQYKAALEKFNKGEPWKTTNLQTQKSGTCNVQ